MAQVICFVILCCILESIVAISVDPGQTVSHGTVLSGSTLLQNSMQVIM